MFLVYKVGANQRVGGGYKHLKASNFNNPRNELLVGPSHKSHNNISLASRRANKLAWILYLNIVKAKSRNDPVGGMERSYKGTILHADYNSSSYDS